MNSAARFAAFDISIVHRDRDHYWLSVDCELGAIKAHPVVMPEWGDLEGATTPLEWLGEKVKRHAIARKDGLEIGRILSELVFGSAKLRDLFVKMRARVAASNRELVVQILGAPDHVADWPWELLADPEDPKTYLTMTQRVHVARTPKERDYRLAGTAVAPPLNVLVVMSNPLVHGAETAGDVAPFDLYEEKRQLLKNLAPLIDKGLIRVDVEDRPRIDTLRARVRSRKRGYHILHYLGHASPNGLLIEDQSGAHSLLSADSLCDILKHSSSLKVALFAGCETARSPATNAPEGALSIAHTVAREVAPIVVGMQVVLPFHTQRLFSHTFYEALAAGRSVADAVHTARSQVWDGHDGTSGQLDWSIPTLLLGDATPGQVFDPSVQPIPPVPVQRVSLRINAKAEALRFVARHTNLRRVIDVLSNRTTERLITIRGEGVQPADLSGLLFRALEELDTDVACLSFAAKDLNAHDPADHLRACFLEILRQAGADITWYDASSELIRDDRLANEIRKLRLAIGIDGADALEQDGAAFGLLRKLLLNPGQVRVAIVHPHEFNPFNAELIDYAETTTVRPLGWTEVWIWIMDRLPELARLGEDTVHGLHATFGDRLQDWEAYNTELIKVPEGARRGEIAKMTDAVPGGSAEPDETLVFSQTDNLFAPQGLDDHDIRSANAETADHRPKPVSLSVAGPQAHGRDAAFVTAISRFAESYGLQGSVAGSDRPGATIVAQTQLIPSPFDENGRSTSAKLFAWAAEVGSIDSSIVVCDFGGKAEIRPLTDALTGLMNDNRLVIAAAGHDGVPYWPAWQADVLAVGAARGKTPTPYSVYFPDANKPEIFAPETLLGTELEGWLKNPSDIGTSFAALYAAAVAAIVWASYRTLTAFEVRDLLIGPDAAPRMLDPDAALQRMAQQKVCDLLETGRMSLMRVVSEAGLPPALTTAAVESLTKRGDLLEHNGQLEFTNRLEEMYAKVREAPPSAKRTQAQGYLMSVARGIVRRRGLSVTDRQGLWASGQLGLRILALASIYENPEGAFKEIIFDGIADSMSAFEQFHALALALNALEDLGTQDRLRLREILEAPTTTKWFTSDRDRQELARRILDRL